MNGERVGRWTVTRQGEHRFDYETTWLQAPLARAISLSLPLRPEGGTYRGEAVEAFFDNLLPEGDLIRRRMMSQYGASSSRPFELLAEVGQDCIGAVQLLPEETTPKSVRSIHGEPLSEGQIATLLRHVGTTGIPGQEDGDFRISLAGNQEKTALLFHENRWQRAIGTTPTTHIFKLPMGDASTVGVDFSTSVENEWLCGQILEAFKIPVAKSEIATFEDQKVLIVERFDRRRAANGKWVMRLPQEDFCQATGTPPERKYEKDGGPGIERLMQLLLGADHPAEDRADLFRTLFVYWLLCAIDGHAKNFSISLQAGGGFSLTPRYDVRSAYPVLGRGPGRLPEQKVKMAMAVISPNRHYRWQEIRGRHWLETARRCGLPLQDARTALAELIEGVDQVVDTVREKLPKKFPGAVAESVFDGLRSTAERASRTLS